jgi:hypothetical protein
MLDTRLQERFTRGCTDAAFGYTAATTAAYAAFAEQVFSFWAGALRPAPEPAPAQTVWGWPLPAPRQEPAAMPFFPFAWAAPQRPSTPAVDPFAGANAAFTAWLDMFSYAAAPPAAWPMAFMMIASGVPRSVAFPTAEANVAVMDAADAAAVSVQRVMSSYRTDGGHAVARQSWPPAHLLPPAHLMMLAMLVPLNFGTMLTSMRVG